MAIQQNNERFGQGEVKVVTYGHSTPNNSFKANFGVKGVS
jgi:hypothetical protein